MKPTIYILIGILFSVNVFAQGGKHMNKRSEIMKKQVEFVIEELQLTEKEKKEFVPIFKEYNQKKEQLFIKKREKMRKFHKNSLNMSDVELLELSDFIVNTNIQLAELEKTYYNKFKKVIPPLKLVLLQRANKKFKMKLFKEIKHKGQRQKMN